MNNDTTTNAIKSRITNIEKAQAIAIYETIEEEVPLLIDRATVTCFASYCPYEIRVKSFYELSQL